MCTPPEGKGSGEAVKDSKFGNEVEVRPDLFGCEIGIGAGDSWIWVKRKDVRELLSKLIDAAVLAKEIQEGGEPCTNA